MIAGKRLKLFRIFASGPSMRRRVAYSFGIVRLILAPVIFLAVYYLFVMWGIVDRIVSVDAAVATGAEQASIEMLDARRAERAYFLGHADADLEANQHAVTRLEETIHNCRTLNPEQSEITDQMLAQVKIYKDGMAAVEARTASGTEPAIDRVRGAVRTYESDLNQLIRSAPRLNRSKLIQQLHDRTSSFDAEVAAAGSENPAVQATAQSLQTSSEKIMRLASTLEERSWQDVQRDHQKARDLLHRSEWVLGIVSILVVLLSVWVSITLPRQVVKPLMDLKDAVDHAAAGNYEIEFDLQGKAEIIQLANSVRNLIAHLRQKTADSHSAPPTESRKN